MAFHRETDEADGMGYTLFRRSQEVCGFIQLFNNHWQRWNQTWTSNTPEKTARWLKVAGAQLKNGYLLRSHASPKLRKSSILPGMMNAAEVWPEDQRAGLLPLGRRKMAIQRRRFVWSYVILCGFVLFLVFSGYETHEIVTVCYSLQSWLWLGDSWGLSWWHTDAEPFINFHKP